MACGPDPMVGEVDAVQAWPESISHVQEAANRLEGKMESSDESAGNVVFNITISAPRPHRPPIEAALATLENSIPVAALKMIGIRLAFCFLSHSPLLDVIHVRQ